MTSGPEIAPDALLLDASVWLAAVDAADRFHADSRGLIRTRRVLALDLTMYEVTNVAVRVWHAPALARALADLVLGAVAAPPFAVTATVLRAAVGLAAKHAITVYDASYAAVAGQLGVRLVSCDERDLIANGLAIAPRC